MLHHEVRGTGPGVALLHGFTQSGRSWDAVADALADGHRVVTVDAPGHGGSAGVDADLWAGARLAADTVAGAVGGPAAWVGYSMGGRLALHVALDRPDLVDRLVLVSTSAGIEDPAARTERRAADEVLAARIETEGTEAFVRWWLERPLFATLPAAAARLDARLGNTPAGLASSLRRAGAGTMDPLWDRLGELTMPVLVVVGGLDPTYRAHGARLAESVGGLVQLVVVPGAGHSVHLEQPGAFLDAVIPFLL